MLFACIVPGTTTDMGGLKCIVQVKYGEINGVVGTLIIDSNVMPLVTSIVLLTTILSGVFHVIIRGMADGP